tara:strand:+ start:967 stop:1407 length:441 start_codon:yes stop_codon:yes gene_type:complete
MRIFIFLIFFFSLGINAQVKSENLEFIFDWSDLKKCTSGNPRIVSNPIFYLNNIPGNTQYIKFSLKDRNVPSYSHGGGKVDVSEIKVIKENETNYGKYKFIIETGKFKYKSPCPPSGKHVYEWSAMAKDEKNKTIGKRARSKQKYP